MSVPSARRAVMYYNIETSSSTSRLSGVLIARAGDLYLGSALDILSRKAAGVVRVNTGLKIANGINHFSGHGVPLSPVLSATPTGAVTVEQARGSTSARGRRRRLGHRGCSCIRRRRVACRP